MIVATAGHVDHGKTTLVKALTGVDTDRLPEEKKRGMTIDLGFAYMPSADRTIGFVDVPGHERFIHNMLAGMAGIDFVLLVVAADDGPMPQTLEHLVIVDLLGVADGAVALTKIDRVTPARLDDVRKEIDSAVAWTSLAGMPVFPLCARSGEGVGMLKARLEEAAREQVGKAVEGNFRLSVDRVFSVAGAGLVLTGTAISGAIAVGTEVRVLLADKTARIRSIHAHNRVAQTGCAGQRLALNLAGIEVGGVSRGDWIVTGGAQAPVARFDGRLKAVGDKPLRHWTPVHVHLGAANVTGRIAVLEGNEISPGTSSLVQLVLERPIGALYGDRFIIRDQSAKLTLGGGVVIDAFPPRRGRAKARRLTDLAAMELADPADALRMLSLGACQYVNLREFAVNRNLPVVEAECLSDHLDLKRAGFTAFSVERWQAARTEVLAALEAWHRRSPHQIGPEIGRLLESAAMRLPSEVATKLVQELVREGAIVREGPALRRPTHRLQLSREDSELWQTCRSLLELNHLRPPTVSEIAANLRAEARVVAATLSRLERHGLVVRVSKSRFYVPGAVAKLRDLAEAEAREKGVVTAAGLRDRAGIGRNATIELLEYFDRIKFTRRAGDTHVLLARGSVW